MIKQIFLKELMTMKPMIHINVLFAIIITFLNKFQTLAEVYNGCHDVIQEAVGFNDVTIVYV